MRRFLLGCLAVVAVTVANAQTQADTALRIVSWNIEWFGSTEAGPPNKNLQERNVVRILRFLDADIYALGEIVDTMRMRRVVDSLGANYGFTISDFCSAVASPDFPNWLTCQKLAYVYRKDVVSNVRVRGMLRASQNAYYNFASGRFPYLLNANVNKNGKKRNINVINIHAKSGTTSTDYTRRRNGAIELKDTLDQFFSRTPVILVGDYNDELHRSISGFGTSPYQVIVADSNRNNANYYRSITLPLSYAGENSTIGFSTVIDHQIINKRMDSMYIAGSAAIRKDVLTVVPDYNARNTSDHYPVFSSYSVIAGDTSVFIAPPPPPPPAPPIVQGFKIGPNPFSNVLYYRSGKTLTDVTMALYNAVGAKVWQRELATIPANVAQQTQVPSSLPPGVYIFRLLSKEETHQLKLVK
ncbi:T9SS type A sorting domain-containing protein [Aridibaculum aurantiacum]|uniref:T9SS type A sorting domain-containing protein n=1 Tax=Aridibaculum aurantiacum TaxID=2810307 RepID=UPI001A96EBF4|nr:T9SS type A sorting domain-containing protein [Aridibaculum aurantiacum]